MADDLKSFADEVHRAAKKSAGFHDRAYVSSVHENMQTKMSLDSFKSKLFDAHRAGHVRVTRADLTGAMNLAHLDRSAFGVSSGRAGAGDSFHLIEAQGRRPHAEDRPEAEHATRARLAGSHSTGHTDRQEAPTVRAKAASAQRKGKPYITVEGVGSSKTVVDHPSKAAAHAYAQSRARAGAVIFAHSQEDADKHGLDPRKRQPMSKRSDDLHPKLVEEIRRASRGFPSSLGGPEMRFLERAYEQHHGHAPNDAARRAMEKVAGVRHVSAPLAVDKRTGDKAVKTVRIANPRSAAGGSDLHLRPISTRVSDRAGPTRMSSTFPKIRRADMSAAESAAHNIVHKSAYAISGKMHEQSTGGRFDSSRLVRNFRSTYAQDRKSVVRAGANPRKVPEHRGHMGAPPPKKEQPMTTKKVKAAGSKAGSSSARVVAVHARPAGARGLVTAARPWPQRPTDKLGVQRARLKAKPRQLGGSNIGATPAAVRASVRRGHTQVKTQIAAKPAGMLGKSGRTAHGVGNIMTGKKGGRFIMHNGKKYYVKG